MTDINHVVLIGRITRDADLKYTASGIGVCKFSLALNRQRKSGDKWEDEANFFDIIIFGKMGENLHQYLVKGKAVAIDGELRQERWQQDGQNRSKVSVVANVVQLLGTNQQPNSTEKSPEKSDTSGNSGGTDNFTDDIPF